MKDVINKLNDMVYQCTEGAEMFSNKAKQIMEAKGSSPILKDIMIKMNTTMAECYTMFAKEILEVRRMVDNNLKKEKH